MELRLPHISTKTKLTEVLSSTRFKALLQHLISQDCEISNLIYRALICDRYTNPKKAFNYIDFREKQGMISYQPFGKEQKYCENGKWLRAGRQEVKPAKFAKEFLHPRLIAKFKDHEIATFSTKIKAFEEGMLSEIVFADSVDEAYTFSNYGTEVESCMMDKPVGDFYDSFGVKVLIAKRKSTGKLFGRALYWPSVKIQHNGESFTVPFMDRIYSANVEIAETFIQYAKKHNIWYKKAQSNNGYDSIIDADGQTRDGVTMTVEALRSIGDDDNIFYPYLDTFLYGDDDQSLTNKGTAQSYAIYRNTDGEREVFDAENYVVLYDGSALNRRADSIEISGSWYSRYSHLITTAVLPDGSITYRLRDDEDIILAGNNLYYHKDCVATGILIHASDGKLYPSSEVVYIDEEVYYMYSDEITYSDYRQRYYLTKDVVMVIMEHASPNSWYGPRTSNMLKDDPDIGLCAKSGDYYLKTLLTVDKAGQWVYNSPSSVKDCYYGINNYTIKFNLNFSYDQI